MHSHNKVLVELRSRICGMQRDYNDIRSRTRLKPYQDLNDRDALRRLHYRLSYLAPLCRALSSLVQQGGAAGAGELQYRKCFERLRLRSRVVLSQPNKCLQEMHCGAEMADLLLPVPAPKVPVNDWSVRNLADIIQSVCDDIDAEQRDSVRRWSLAKEARTAFLASLTAEQRDLLREALDSARENGRHALSFDHRDLAAAR